MGLLQAGGRPVRGKVDRVWSHAQPARMPCRVPGLRNDDVRRMADGAPEERHTLARQTWRTDLDDTATKAFTLGVDETTRKYFNQFAKTGEKTYRYAAPNLTPLTDPMSVYITPV